MDLKAILEYIDPSDCNYQEWVNVGMALKYEGYTAVDWDCLLYTSPSPQDVP